MIFKLVLLTTCFFVVALKTSKIPAAAATPIATKASTFPATIATKIEFKRDDGVHRHEVIIDLMQGKEKDVLGFVGPYESQYGINALYPQGRVDWYGWRSKEIPSEHGVQFSPDPTYYKAWVLKNPTDQERAMAIDFVDNYNASDLIEQRTREFLEKRAERRNTGRSGGAQSAASRKF